MKKEPVIHVPSGYHAVVTAANMFDDEYFDVRYVIDDEKCNIEDADDVPYSPNGTQVFVANTHNPVILTVPGYYRVVARGVVNDNARLFSKLVSAPKGC